MLWENPRSEEFKDAVDKCNGVCVIPIGCVDAHSVHLPLGWDMHYGLNERIAKAIAQKTVETTADAFDFIRKETVSVEFHKEWLAKQ